MKFVQIGGVFINRELIESVQLRLNGSNTNVICIEVRLTNQALIPIPVENGMTRTEVKRIVSKALNIKDI